jgi:hypothetical protein
MMANQAEAERSRRAIISLKNKRLENWKQVN